MTREDMLPIEMEIVELLHKKTESPHDALGVLAAVTLAIQLEEVRKYLDVLGYVKRNNLIELMSQDIHKAHDKKDNYVADSFGRYS